MALLKLMDNHLLAALRATNLLDVRRAQLWTIQHLHAPLLIQIRAVQAHDDINEFMLQARGDGFFFIRERGRRGAARVGDAARRLREHLNIKSRELVVLHRL